MPRSEAGQFAGQLLDSIATTQGPVSSTLSPGSSEPAPRAACLLALTQPAFAKAWHEAVDRAEGFSELMVAEFEKHASKLEAEIRAREVELERRRILAAHEEADQELALLEKRL